MKNIGHHKVGHSILVQLTAQTLLTCNSSTQYVSLLTTVAMPITLQKRTLGELPTTGDVLIELLT
jgi:hypothetical protein